MSVIAGLTVRRTSLDEILALRHAELRPGFPEDAAVFEGDGEPTTWHFGAFLASGANVGCASFMRRPRRGEDAHQLRGMATRRDVLHRGIGSALLATAERHIRDATGIRLFWCNARVAAIPFYERMGWTAVSEVFDIATVGPHRTMLRRCPAAG